MKKILMAVVMLPLFSYAEVKVHTKKFNNVPAGSGTQFWARMYNWKGWSKTAEQKVLGLTSNYVKKAYDELENDSAEKETVFKGTPLLFKDFQDVLGKGVETQAAYEFYRDRASVNNIDDYEDIDDHEYIKERGAVFISKTQVDLDKNYDFNKSLEDVVKVFSQADSAHINKVITEPNWAHNFIDGLHTGHNNIDSKGILSLTVINFGSHKYQCSDLNGPIRTNMGLSGISVYGKQARIYLVNKFEEVKNVNSLKGIVETGAKKVFVQKVIYSSSLIKSGVNYISLHQDQNGKKKLVLTSVSVSTDKVLMLGGILETYLNGPDLLSAGAAVVTDVGGAISRWWNNEEKKDHIILGPKDLDLKKTGNGRCEQGLGLGVASYIYNMALNIAKAK